MENSDLIEINIDGLVGPTHHFGGLGVGNIASQQHALQVSHPRAAALEGLRKASLVASLGIPQFILLPPPRPCLGLLSQVGFQGSLAEQLQAAFETAPQALSAAFSSAFMWAANAATVSPAVDTTDGRMHITPANLISSWHRATEAQERRQTLQSMFAQVSNCAVHASLPAVLPLRDEGAANHMRLCDASGQIGFHVFVYGDGAGDETFRSTGFFPRQSRAACEAIARRHTLHPARTFFLRQHPQAIAAGVFHNDVIATSHQHYFIHHERAFIDSQAELERLTDSFHSVTGTKLLRTVVADDELSLEEAVGSYFFNSQIVVPQLQSSTAGAAAGGASSADRGACMVLICPRQCEQSEHVRQWIERLIAAPDNPLAAVHYVDLQQSMAGGGGPACLRLRVPLPREEFDRIPTTLRLNAHLLERLTIVIERWYPEKLELRDFCDSEFVEHLLHIAGEFHRACL